MFHAFKHTEIHKSDRIGWLRAVVLGANDGIVSTASLIVGVASAQMAPADVLMSGVAGLVAGAMSMAAGEYVSVSSQSDTEKADLARERRELIDDPKHELEELANIYVARGLDQELALKVAEQLTLKDALGAHARDELGITDFTAARPIQAAAASAATFSIGAGLPLLVVLISSPEHLVVSVSVVSLLSLISLGLISSRIGGSSLLLGAARVGFWGAFAMAATSLVGKMFGTIVL
jgi:VIT1/CCC1 family predicted Fe2+/Mn2+ transporter